MSYEPIPETRVLEARVSRESHDVVYATFYGVIPQERDLGFFMKALQRRDPTIELSEVIWSTHDTKVYWPQLFTQNA